VAAMMISVVNLCNPVFKWRCKECTTVHVSHTRRPASSSLCAVHLNAHRRSAHCLNDHVRHTLVVAALSLTAELQYDSFTYRVAQGRPGAALCTAILEPDATQPPLHVQQFSRSHLSFLRCPMQSLCRQRTATLR
jgi:hypothetical protein